jgi:hypothetical protein
MAYTLRMLRSRVNIIRYVVMPAIPLDGTASVEYTSIVSDKV